MPETIGQRAEEHAAQCPTKLEQANQKTGLEQRHVELSGKQHQRRWQFASAHGCHHANNQHGGSGKCRLTVSRAFGHGCNVIYGLIS